MRRFFYLPLPLLLWFTVVAATDGPGVLPLPLQVPTNGHRYQVAAPQDSYPLAVIANLEYAFYPVFSFGDTDHDGANEIILEATDETFSSYYYRIFEHQGSDVYSVEYTGAPLIPYAVGDLDGDGRSEIVGQWGSQVRIYESADATSYPSQLTWCSPDLTNVLGWTTIGDTDRDGRMEIIHSENYLGGGRCYLVIFENTGDNAFAEVFRGTVEGPDGTGPKLIADLDGDGKTEIALSGGRGWLHVFESPCDNVWELTARLWTGMYNAYAVNGGRDTDGSGRPEVFVLGNVFTDSTSFFQTQVYESFGDNAFQHVTTIVLDPLVGVPYSTLGNLDGVGPEEYVAITGHVRVFRPTTPGRWGFVGEAWVGAAAAYDVNQNGRAELIARLFPQTLVLEHPPVANDVDPDLTPGRGIAVVPNPCRGEAVLRLAQQDPEPARLSVFDVSGRLVERRSIPDPRQQILWTTRQLSPGIYLLRLERRGQTMAQGRAVVTH